MKRLATILVGVFLVMTGGNLPAATVGLIKIDGPIGPATASYIGRAISVANANNDTALIIELDTPGGLLESTKEIVQKFYASPVPTVVYVSPPGASAASAGVFITLAANVAAMAPNTSIGAAHPISIGMTGSEEKLDSVMKEKLENYASSFIETIAERRHRNVEWAKSAVIESKATTSEKALDMGVIDLIAKNVPDLLKQMDGLKVDDKTLNTANAQVVDIPMNAWERFSRMFLRPEVMFVLMLAVIYGIIGELSSPGRDFTGGRGGNRFGSGALHVVHSANQRGRDSTHRVGGGLVRYRHFCAHARHAHSRGHCRFFPGRAHAV